MTLEVNHCEFAQAAPENVWKLWSEVVTWVLWDHGLKWCKLKEGHQFKLGGEALILPHNAPIPITIRIVECSPNRSFTDEAKTEFGSIFVSHEVIPAQGGVWISHSFRYTPANPQAAKVFENKIWPKMKAEVVESVKALAKMAQQEALQQIS